MDLELRPFWRRYFDFNWKLGVFLVLIVCIPRFILVLNANETANYRYIGLIMIISALAPFLFLSKVGRNAIGLTRPKSHAWLFYGFALGLIFSVILYFLGTLMYQSTYENWYVYIGKSYNIQTGMRPNDKLILFVIMSLVGMSFSPVGEEMFFRGIVHSSFAKSLGASKASIIDSAAFALTHISHFGLVYVNDEWTLLKIPTLLWVSGMFLVSIFFYQCRKRSGSLLGAMICHSAFNLGMIYCIFYWLN